MTQSSVAKFDMRHVRAVYERLYQIQRADAFTVEQQAILTAAVLTMAEGFADLAYTQIPDHPSPLANAPLLEFFLCGVRWHWAREHGEAGRESWSTFDIARRCPFTDTAIDLLIRRYEAVVGPLWLAAPAAEGSAA